MKDNKMDQIAQFLNEDDPDELAMFIKIAQGEQIDQQNQNKDEQHKHDEQLAVDVSNLIEES